MEKMINKYQLALDNVFSELRNRPAILSVKLLKSSQPTLQELVDKATPKKPRQDKIMTSWMRCSGCGCRVTGDSHLRHSYCSNCGQAIDWSENHE